MAETGPETFVITARPTPACLDKFGRDGVYRLKRLLKRIGRECGLDVTTIETPLGVVAPTPSAGDSLMPADSGVPGDHNPPGTFLNNPSRPRERRINRQRNS